jgi:Tfp pilus assembly ATPase PilU
LLSFPSKIVCIKVGDQPPSISRVVFNKLFDAYHNVTYIQMEIVPEANSNTDTLNTQRLLSTDEKAAIVIGLRNGKPRSHMVRSIIPEGRVKEIQNWSREKSGNLTIDSELAKLVAVGEITLEEAILIKSGKASLNKIKQIRTFKNDKQGS